MDLALPPLAPIDDDLGQNKNGLPQFFPRFFIPRLQDKPQDPIMDALRFERKSGSSRPETPPELLNMAEMKVQGLSQEEKCTSFWEHAVKKEVRVQSQIRSWDSSRPSFSRIASPGPFLSEQSSGTFAAARHFVSPRLQDPAWHVSHVGLRELFVSIQNILVGNSSSLYRWDVPSETFLLPPATDGKRVFIVAASLHFTFSFLKRFLVIGSLLRRLDMFVNGLRRRSRTECQSVHSFAHALTTCIENIRLQLSKFPDYNSTQIPLGPSALFLNHDEFEDVLVAIASLCGRSLDLGPSEYPPFLSQPELLLSSIYTHLQHHFEKDSMLRTRAMLAYIFTVTSDDYFQTLGLSIGYYGAFPAGQPKTSFNSSGFDLGEGEQEDNESISNSSVDEFPGFHIVGCDRDTHASEKIFKHSSSRRKISWFWTSEKVSAVWDSKDDLVGLSETIESEPVSAMSPIPSLDSGILEQFKVFSCEPGAHLGPSARGAESTLQSFLVDFPPYLPPLTPTLSLLSDLVLSPLIAHGTFISGALISLLLSPRSHLHIHSHLVLLRSYLFLTLPAFTMRLQAALFSDSDDWNFEGSTMRAMAKSTRKSAVSGGSGAKWAVGLGLGLAERDSWPPGGSDLSYYLRTVIVDSLESLIKLTGGELLEEFEGRRRIFMEGEYRLGFAIRDLPAGSGRERWLNASSIEALDFLLMDYKPPPPLDVVITPGVLSKYQRIFSFILRLLRVQNALAALFRMSRESPLFPTLTSANDATAAVPILGAVVHIYDHVTRTFTDVFELADAHSDMMDDVLSACLLRSSQRTAGDALRGCMEIALELCVLAGERRRGRIEEYAAVPLLETLHASFVERMNILIKTLREQVEKESASSHISLERSHLVAEGLRGPKATGGAGSLHHLLIRLDIGLDERTPSSALHTT
ncbi:hypothetical protein F5148DRAFT_1283248 [Russula earlei]|uniref:Uncharacterized protein n=1 Tax=Russula earlei TaxID=71964 RepID=A0ACC0UCF9_9AGAM|nr:hypothetical protein F5148DRAFT_1283248 [Russula earlei]